MLREFTREENRLVPLEPTGIAEAPPPVWLDLITPGEDEIRSVEARLGLTLPSRAEMQDIELSARLYEEDDAAFMTMTAVTNLDSEEPVKSPITFILKGQTLVTLRHVEPKPFETYLLRARRQNGGIPCASGELVMTGLLEALIDRLADALERIGGEVDEVSREIFRMKTASATQKTRDLTSLIERIGRKGEFITAVRESLVSIVRLVNHHAALHASDRKGSKEARQHLKMIQRDAAHLQDHATFLSNKINFLLDATLGLINLEQNQIIKIFSIAAVVFLPPTLVASSYGMNFKNIPELEWVLGYPWALSLMVISAAIPFLYFKRRGWL